MWRYDAGRSAASPNQLPVELNFLWKQTFSERRQAWDDPLNLDLMTYDRCFEPIVVNNQMFVGFNDQDKLISLNADTGELRWTVYADGPIRMAPVADQDRVFVCSDDGHLDCLDIETGSLLWKFSAATSSQKALGNQRLVSAWPARGGPVIYGDTIYFANSIWPFMGTFISALDKETGAVRWMNDSTSAQYIKQPHSAPAFAGVAPQGMLVATEDLLIVPGGRSVPAVFDRHTGELLYFHLNEGGKGTGGSFVTVDEKHFYVHTRERGPRAFNLETGDKTAFMPNEPLVTKHQLIVAERSEGKAYIRAYPSNLDSNETRETLWEIEADGASDLCLARDVVVAASGNQITLIKLLGTSESQESGPTGGEIIGKLNTDSSIARVLVASGKLFAVTNDGSILAFGQASADSTTVEANPRQHAEYASEVVTTEAAQKVYRLLALGDPQGYGYWFGDCDTDLITAWANLSPFQQLAIVHDDPGRITQMRQHLDRLSAYGKVTAHAATASQFLAPEYTGNMVFVDARIIEEEQADSIRAIYKSVRPYGGTMVLVDVKLTSKRLAWLESLALEKAEFSENELGIVVKRVGRLPGSADWTHQYGNVANTIKSDDQRVKLPLGILWFGGSSNMDVLPRHGHGPPQQVVGGRLFIEGMSSLSARDVYTGRVLWKREFGDLGNYDVYYDDTYEDTPLNPQYNQVHIPGANGRGTNYVVTEDRIYLVVGNRCLILDPATGKDLGQVVLPTEEDGNTAEWGYIAVYEDVLLGGLGFAMYRDRYALTFDSDNELKSSRKGFGSKSLDRAASRALVGFDRFTGAQLWRVVAPPSGWHNGIVAGGGRVYCLDRHPQAVEEALQRRGLELPDTYRIWAIDFKTGQPVWQVNESIFGSWLGYSEEHELLLQAGAQASDRLYAEVGQGMRVYNAGDGSLKWSKDDLKYSGPCVLHNDLIITNANSYSESAGAFDLRTGEQWVVTNPITGLPEPWKMTRAYGCNSIVASENLLTFRSGSAGYYDLLNDSGTGNLGGFRSGCTSNLIIADGVLNAPDYTRTCSCSYQNQTSLALVPMSGVENWSIHPLIRAPIDGETPVQSLGLNFGAPGDRRDADGVMWIEYPNLSGDQPPLAITINPEAQPFLRHSSAIGDDPFAFVYASGLEGVRELSVRLLLVPQAPEGESESGADVEQEPSAVSSSPHDLGPYDVELFFSVPASQIKNGEKSNIEFEVRVQGGEHREIVSLPINTQATVAGRTDAAIARVRFENVIVDTSLGIALKPISGTPVISGMRIQRASSVSTP